MVSWGLIVSTMSKTSIVIPVPDNPQHTNNLKSIQLLEAQGFKGPDASLEESLFEYGLAWRVMEKETLFIYRIGENRFDRTVFSNDLDVIKEFNWVSWTEIANHVGTPLPEWINFPLDSKIYDLFMYHGWENIFGSSYWEGFKIETE